MRHQTHHSQIELTVYLRTGSTDNTANPNDLTGIPAGPTTEQQGARGHKRKQTLLSLLDALAELSKDEELDGLSECQSMLLTSQKALSCQEVSSWCLAKLVAAGEAGRSLLAS